jgi:glucose/arabinose dehydrogenase
MNASENDNPSLKGRSKMTRRAMALAVAIATACAPVALAADGPPPPPKAAGGQKVTVVARGVPTPTAFAFLGGQTFVAGFGDEQHPKVTGGVYVLRGGKPIKLAGSPPHVFGLATSGGTLYLSDGRRILAWSGWNGTKFTKSEVVATGPKRFSGFNGIVVSPDGGTIYSGVSLSNGKKADYAHGITPYANDVVGVDVKSGAIAVAAKGMRQPWQLAYVPGHSGPLVSDLGQENLAKGFPPDRLLEVKAGANFGFPTCPAQPAKCAKFTKPFAQFPAHASPMGLAALGGKVYVALFGGTDKGPEVVALPASGGTKFIPLLTGFVAPVVALGVHGGQLYAGDLTGSVYSVKP